MMAGSCHSTKTYKPTKHRPQYDDDEEQCNGRGKIETPTFESLDKDPSSSLALSQTSNEDNNIERPKNGGIATPSGSSSRSSSSSCRARWIKLVVGIMMLVMTALAVSYFANKKGYSFKRGDKAAQQQHANYQANGVSVATMALHNVETDCWMEIHGNVYDMTEYAPQHPGGPEYVTDFCGMSATRDYDKEHSVSLLRLVAKYNLGPAVAADDSSTPNDGQGNGGNGTPSTVGVNGGAAKEGSGDSTSSEDSSNDVGNNHNQVVVVPQPVPTSPATPKAPTVAAGGTSPSAYSPTLSPAASPPGGCPVPVYSAADVTQHDSQYDCWYILYDVVYDFTSYIDKHPGGARRVFEHCGTDATIPYSQESKHDEKLLAKEVPHLAIGYAGAETGVRYVPC